MSSDYQLEDTLHLPFTTRAFATGIPTVLAGTPAIDIYEDVTAAPIVTGETLAVSLNGVVGFNMITVTATAGTGFEAGKSYTAIIEAGTVDSVSVVGEVVAHFTLDKSAAAKDLANGTDGLGAIKAETALIVEDTSELQSDDVPGLIAALNDITAAAVWAVATRVLTAGTNLNDISVNDIFTTQLADVYAGNTVLPTAQQAWMAIHQALMAHAISGTSWSVKKIDGVAEAFVITLDDASDPNQAIRS